MFTGNICPKDYQALSQLAHKSKHNIPRCPQFLKPYYKTTFRCLYRKFRTEENSSR